MTIFSTYSIKIKNNEYKKLFNETTKKYRNAVDFFIAIYLKENSLFSSLKTSHDKLRKMELLTISTKRNQFPKYDFSLFLYKFPVYYRRAAISEAIGKAESYLSNLKNWQAKKTNKRPGYPKAGFVYPSLYRDNTFVRDDTYTAKVKVWINNTWDWVSIDLNRGDVDYIMHHCQNRKECVPTMQKRGKQWFLDFGFEEKIKLNETALEDQIVLGVDLGINSACVCSAMRKDGTILGREFLSLPREQDSLSHAVNRVKKAQQHGATKTPRLWAKVKGINDRISVLTAEFIISTAQKYNASVIVFEHLDKGGKKCGKSKQKIALWKSQYVQEMVTNKAHRLGIRISHVNAWGTSKLAFDGSGWVLRGKEAGFKTNSICKFSTGKIYNCDLNASYNIAARHIIRETLKSLPATLRLGIEAKVPQCTKRSTCTLSTLISLNAALMSVSA